MCSTLVLKGQVQLLVSNDPGLVVPMNLVLLVIVIDGCPSSMYFRHKKGSSLGHLQQKFDGTSELKQNFVSQIVILQLQPPFSPIAWDVGMFDSLNVQGCRL